MNLQAEAARPALMIWPSVPIWRKDGQLWLDRKFKDGMDAYAERWPGRVLAAMHVEDIASLSPFGAWAWRESEARFGLEIIERGQTLAARQLQGVGVLLASADDHRQLGAASLCRSVGVACLYVIEYTLRTRLDMTRHSTASAWQRLKTAVWHLGNERRIRRAMRLCDGIQANGIPAFRAYRGDTSSALLYFDTRLPREALIRRDELDLRLADLRRGGAIRLAFSGRLIAAKGADAIVPLALRLKQLDVDFVFDVFGSGEFAEVLREDVATHGLAESVRLRGAVDFDDALMPALKRQVDLFVCCHRQGDPSCTYAETLGCGVPIVGFANESLSALVDDHAIGWTVPMGAVHPLAALIAGLAARREEINEKSMAALRFAERHHCQSAFDLRTKHCVDALRT
jgi:glycosyltransferase involved in cell wall biosynthesis